MDAGFRTFFLDEYDGMLRLAFSLVSRVEDAEDAVQGAFFDVARHWDSVRRPGAYLRTAVVNHCRSILRRREMAGRPRPLAPGTDPVGPEPAAPELIELLDQLPERTRTAIVLRYYADLSSVEIGLLLDCPAATVRSIVRRALRQLRKELP